MANLRVHFSSATGEWETPQDVFDRLHAEFFFDLDVCATAENAKCRKFFTKEQDGLAQPWGPRVCFMNPPYGREVGKWVKKAYDESLRGATVVCLLPARTDTGWFWDYCQKGEIRFIRGRVKFVGANGKAAPAPFPSMIVVFRPKPPELER